MKSEEKVAVSEAQAENISKIELKEKWQLLKVQSVKYQKWIVVLSKTGICLKKFKELEESLSGEKK
jgi:5-bromo-4-chloroindolyl phosphate hydrolysis protein